MRNRLKVYSISALSIQVVKTDPPGLSVHVEGDVSTPGWSEFALQHYVYVQPPPDGIYEADVVGAPPEGPTPDVITPFFHSETWIRFPQEHLKGLRVHSGTNSVTTMLE